MARMDHLVVAATSLAAGSVWLEQRLGVALQPGGQHLAMGTHNRLLRLGDDCYLELIAIDPSLPAPARPRWFSLDAPDMQQRLAAGPQLIHWVVATNNIETEAGLAGYAKDSILTMSRGDYRWRVTVPADGGLIDEGLRPSLIQWDVPMHPARQLPDSGCRLMKLEALSDCAAELKPTLVELGLHRALDLQPAPVGDAPEWLAYLETSAGLVEIGGRLTR